MNYRDMGSFETLLPEEVIEAKASAKSDKLFVGGYIDFLSRHLTLFTADSKCYVVEFDMLLKNDPSLTFQDLSFTDYGNTVVIGNYEFSSSSLIAEMDNK